MAYWLFKTEPNAFSLEDLRKAPAQGARWDEIRNYQARNFLRDGVALGDTVFIYHSQCKVPGVVGTAEVARAAYPDPSQFDPDSNYYDAKSPPGNPRWFCVDLRYCGALRQTVSLAQIKHTAALKGLMLLQQGRLSVMPVTVQHAHVLLALGGGSH